MKKLISILSSLVLALQLTTAYAAGTPTVSLSKVEGNIGEQVVVQLKMENVECWSNVWWEIEYDNTALELASHASSKVVKVGIYGDEDSAATMWRSQQKTEMPYHLGWNCFTVTCAHSGVMAELKFNILETAKAGETYELTLKPHYPNDKSVDGEHMNFWEDVEGELDGAKHPISFTYVNGSITIPGGEVETTLAAAKADGKVSITATGEEITGKFIVAGYNDNGKELVDVVVLNAAAEAKDIKVAGSTVKVMWWDSIEGMTSIAPAVTL